MNRVSRLVACARENNSNGAMATTETKMDQPYANLAGKDISWSVTSQRTIVDIKCQQDFFFYWVFLTYFFA